MNFHLLATIVFLLNFNFCLSFYRCKLFRTTWQRYIDNILNVATWDHTITASSSHYDIRLFNMYKNLTSPLAVDSVNLVDDSYYNAPYSSCSFDIFGPDDDFCQFSSKSCNYTCQIQPYDVMLMAISYIADSNVMMDSWISLYNDMVYPFTQFRMLTPENPEIINVEENGEIWQKCIEFDYTPDPIADGNN